MTEVKFNAKDYVSAEYIISGAINLEYEDVSYQFKQETEDTSKPLSYKLANSNLEKVVCKCSNNYCTCFCARKPKTNFNVLPFYIKKGKQNICLICQEVFLSQDEARNHLKMTRCGNEDIQMLLGKKEFQKYFKKECDVYKCTKCQKKYTVFGQIVDHLKITDCGTKKEKKPPPDPSDGFHISVDGDNFQCNFCDHIVKSRSGMRWHINHQHKPRKDYTKFYVRENGRICCSNCLKPYSSFNALSIHLDTNKTGCGEEPTH